jgi:hypothetical protein
MRVLVPIGSWRPPDEYLGETEFLFIEQISSYRSHSEVLFQDVIVLEILTVAILKHAVGNNIVMEVQIRDNDLELSDTPKIIRSKHF